MGEVVVTGSVHGTDATVDALLDAHFAVPASREFLARLHDPAAAEPRMHIATTT